MSKRLVPRIKIPYRTLDSLFLEQHEQLVNMKIMVDRLPDDLKPPFERAVNMYYTNREMEVIFDRNSDRNKFCNFIAFGLVALFKLGWYYSVKEAKWIDAKKPLSVWGHDEKDSLYDSSVFYKMFGIDIREMRFFIINEKDMQLITGLISEEEYYDD